ncbi:MAG: RimK family alpha-L-glutamate ligase, partial [Chromatiales bacterium]|nr:RimK family alpha-L-glutamate ligase [Chromatiales bacterium]
SQGVIKVETRAEYLTEATRLLEKSELIIAQEFMPTEFDWRIGVFNRRALYACRYYMVGGHWQILQHGQSGLPREGRTEGVPLDQVPAHIVATALKVSNLIGNGLYGVDLKEVGSRIYVMEVNDNPNIDHGVEDTALGMELYLEIMRGLLARVEERKGERKPR